MSLTERERELVRALSEGLSNREIAARLGVKPQTVRNSLNTVYEKLQVRSRLQLAVKAIREKIVE
jgi:DNA-binding NarL/FixJ family response regulator